MKEILEQLGIEQINSGVYADRWLPGEGPELASVSPIDGNTIATVKTATEHEYEQVLAAADAAFREWRRWPAPRRGEVIRELGDELRRLRDPLGQLVTLEMGKILPEGIGEVQEMIDICDFAVGLSRQLYGLSMHSERPGHRMYEQWHPLGNVGVISAFNFPVAVWSWNAAIAAVCGDSTIWKPSHHTPLTALAVQKICERVVEKTGAPQIFSLLTGKTGRKLPRDGRVPLVSATGSTAMGKIVGEQVGARLGRTILELGGNNAVLVTEGADLDLVIRATLFGAVGTAGQRCTSTRRLLLQKPIAGEVLDRLVKAYAQVRIGDPLAETTVMGPLVAESAVADYENALKLVKEQGGEILCGGKVMAGMPSGCYVEPTIVKAKADMPIVQEETFAPILYAIEAQSVDELIAIQNNVPQGLSSAMFTLNMRYGERFLSSEGSDCGIANINIGTSGAEIGGAFGGEKETGGGREAGSDSWKAYMRRQTVTINYSTELPLAQGIEFGK
ncbi:MAG: aldehyde dehydrogenase family protein [Proteobacteria bacterium]|nr:MAG: aldehyde dehydrogenase family protein [Pseudomonadota bacterium]PIE18453.1 MAG: aldehyde dehydrogenase family protein [Pseudomonadota bacterium]